MAGKTDTCVMCDRPLPGGGLGSHCRATLLHAEHGKAYRHQMVLALKYKHHRGEIAAQLDDDWLSNRSGDEHVSLYLWLFGPFDPPDFFRPYLTQQKAA